MQPWATKTMASVRNEWHEAPWFVILTIAVAAFVGPGLLFGVWFSLFG